MFQRIIIFILTAALFIMLSACYGEPQDEILPTFTAPAEEINAMSPANQRLLISVETDTDMDFLTISSEQLGGNYNHDITYHQLSNVSVDIGGIPCKLEDAIRDDLITVEEMIAYARIDARNGLCKETHSSKNGLSRFVYTYSDFEIEVTYDIYETPDGKQHLIQDIGFYPPHGSKNVSHSYIDDSSPYGYSIAREDWGIDFEITDVAKTGLILAYSQSGGQQIGQLSLQYYTVYSEDGLVPELDSADDTPVLERQPVADIQMDSTGEIMLNWGDLYGELPAGEYALHLYLYDIYDDSQVHPLMQNFTDNQRYTLTFVVE